MPRRHCPSGWARLRSKSGSYSPAIWPVGMVVIYAVVLGRGDGSAFGSQDLAFWSKNGSLALLPWGLSLGISVYSIGSEGRNVHLLRTLPLPASRIFLAKVLASLLPVGVLSLGASALALWLRGAPLLQAIELLTLIAWMAVGCVVIDTAAAASRYRAEFRYRSGAAHDKP